MVTFVFRFHFCLELGNIMGNIKEDPRDILRILI
jgi:hypothetical protein